MLSISSSAANKRFSAILLQQCCLPSFLRLVERRNVTAVCDPRSHLHGNRLDLCLAASTSLIQINDPNILTNDWYRYDGSWRSGGTAP
jgi:hypothetical protein